MKLVHNTKRTFTLPITITCIILFLSAASLSAQQKQRQRLNPIMGQPHLYSLIIHTQKFERL